jgi:Tfp pilus assembly protein PilF
VALVFDRKRAMLGQCREPAQRKNPGAVPAAVRRFVAALACSVASAGPAAAAPYLPKDDSQVLERLPERRDDTLQRELAALRAKLRADPTDAEAAVELAQRLYDAWSADGDPRRLGHAQAALARWWKQPRPPQEVRVMRAVLRQLNHEFDLARSELLEVVGEDPEHAQAWSWLAAIAMVRADHAAARQACAQLARLDVQPVATACQAQVDAATGQAERAIDALRQSVSASDGEVALQLWLLTRLAETEERLGRHVEAEASYRRALALPLRDGYLQAAFADFLLDRGRAAEVADLLRDAPRSDVLLLRLAIATHRTRAAGAAAHAATLEARFAAARARGDTVHRKEEARFALDVKGDAARALPLAEANFAQQREPADARLLLEAALAARRPGAAAPALRWLRDSKLQSDVLQALATRLQEQR